MGSPLNDSHRRFLQTMMSQGILEGSEVKRLHRHCCEAHQGQPSIRQGQPSIRQGQPSNRQGHHMPETMEEFIQAINGQLRPLFMEIRKGMSEEDGQQHYALVNLAETEITRMAFDYTETELELFKKTMDLVMESENGVASSTDVLNLADQLEPKKMKKKDVELVLQRFVQEQWLCEREGEYILSTRCIMELEQYIRNMYQELVKECNICHNIAIQGQMCESCGVKIHHPCVARYFQGRNEPCCPVCNQFWPHEIPEIQTATISMPPPATTHGTKRRHR